MATIRRATSRKKIAVRLKQRRISAGLTMLEAAGQLKVQRNVWERVEAGMQSIPAERIVDVCAIVKTTVADLLGISEAA
jgi:transcriptional regulator with XRE-family HTH domain